MRIDAVLTYGPILSLRSFQPITSGVIEYHRALLTQFVLVVHPQYRTASPLLPLSSPPCPLKCGNVPPYAWAERGQEVWGLWCDRSTRLRSFLRVFVGALHATLSVHASSQALVVGVKLVLGDG